MEDVNKKKIFVPPNVCEAVGEWVVPREHDRDFEDDQQDNPISNMERGEDDVNLIQPSGDHHSDASENADDTSFPQVDGSMLIGKFNTYPHKMLGLIPKGTYNVINVNVESIDYSNPSPRLKDLSPDSDMSFSQSLFRFPVMAFVGAMTGCTAFFIFISIEFISDIKYNFFTKVFTWCLGQEGDWYLLGGFIFVIFINTVICTFAGILGISSPVSCGSGIPHIKTYLNGVEIPKLFNLKTLVCKVFGVILSVTGGLPVGKEGPMIHSGAIHGAIWPMGCYATDDGRCNWYTPFFKYFRNNVERRDFVAGGAAAGVAAAFGAPLGGLCFAIEEGCSILNLPMIMQTLIASVSSYFTLDGLKSLYIHAGGKLSGGGLVNFGELVVHEYNIAELGIFVIMGIIGGLLGALWNWINKLLTQERMKILTSKKLKLLEVILVSIFITSAACDGVTRSLDCKYDEFQGYDPQQVEGVCPPGTTDTSTKIWFSTPENTVKDLLHRPYEYYNLHSLLNFVWLYFILTCVTYGISVSSGLFIPSLLIGAAWGRAFGHLVIDVVPGISADKVGVFALIGAAAQLSGIVRLTFSLTVIFIEATMSITLGFPLLVTCITAWFTGNMFNHGIYHIHMDLCGIPLLPWLPPNIGHMLTVRDIMSTPVRCLKMRSPASDVFTVLRTTTHNAFPVVDPIIPGSRERRTFGKLRGIVTRQELLTMIKNDFYDSNPERENWEAYTKLFPRTLKTSELCLEDDKTNCGYLDFRNIMNPSPSCVHFYFDFNSIFHHFRSTSARHTVVVNDCNEVVGMVTRKDICSPMLSTKGICFAESVIKTKTWISN